MEKKAAKAKDSNAEFEQALAASERAVYVLRLYVSGSTRNSLKAINNLKHLCETHLAGRYELEIIDIYQQPEYAAREQILAAPTLVKSLPLPVRRCIGSLARAQDVLLQLEIKTNAG